MYKQILTAAALALCLAGPAAADDDRQRGKVLREAQSTRPRPRNGVETTIGIAIATTIAATATTDATTRPRP